MSKLTKQQILDEVEDALSGKVSVVIKEKLLDAVWSTLEDNYTDPEEED